MLVVLEPTSRDGLGQLGEGVQETLAALTDLIRDGKVRAIGASQTPASGIVEAQWVAERRGLARFAAEQPVYSILNRGIERETLPAAQRFGLGTLVWGPLGQGLLTGRVRKNQRNDLRRAGTDVGVLDQAYQPPALQDPNLRRRPLTAPAAA